MAFKKVLWIEDDAFNELSALATPVYYEGEYDLHFAVSATEGIHKLESCEYDAVVVDARLPPGDDQRWTSLFNEAGSDDKAARLGVRLLQNILGRDKKWTASLPRTTVDPRLFGVLSVDSWEDLKSELEPIGVTTYRDKKEGAHVLLEIIRDILARRRETGDKSDAPR